jgi:hypothetical protein
LHHEWHEVLSEDFSAFKVDAPLLEQICQLSSEIAFRVIFFKNVQQLWCDLGGHDRDSCLVEPREDLESLDRQVHHFFV